MVRTLHVASPGLRTTVQDRGRYGWEHIGITRGGALDYRAYRWANALAGNEEDEAVLECLLVGPDLVPEDDVWMAVTGVERVSVGGASRPGWSAFPVPRGVRVQIGPCAGARAYVAVQGGIAVEPVLGSRSTDLLSGFGGFAGRALQGGDELQVGPPGSRRSRTARRPQSSMSAAEPFRFVAESESRHISPRALSAVQTTRFRVSPHSNEIGVRLDGPALPVSDAGTVISRPMPVGAMQLTPAGQLIVLLNARGTIGGYPIVGTVITPDVWRFGQAKPRDEIRLKALSLEEARQATGAALEQLERELSIGGRYAYD